MAKFSTANIKSGDRFKRLVVLGRVPHEKGKSPHFFLRCDCGKEIKSKGDGLVRGVVTSCGCLRTERIKIEGLKKATHRLTGTPMHVIWLQMRRRCLQPNSESYPRYGGRGITICERWPDFLNFLADMGDRPSPKHSLDRIDNNGPYSPENCRWATAAEQAQNRRSNQVTREQVIKARQLIDEGHRKCDVARMLGIKYTAVKNFTKKKNPAWANLSILPALDPSA